MTASQSAVPPDGGPLAAGNWLGTQRDGSAPPSFGSTPTRRYGRGRPPAYRPGGAVRFSPLIVWAMLAGAVSYVLTNNPADGKPDLLGGCGWYTMFGTNGPTCGGTRMVWYLLHGDVVNAARMHLVALVGTPFVLYMLVQWSAEWLLGLRLPPLRLHWWVYVAYGVMFLLYGAVLRNLPGFEWFHIDYMQAGIGL